MPQNSSNTNDRIKEYLSTAELPESKPVKTHSALTLIIILIISVIILGICLALAAVLIDNMIIS